MPEKSLFSIACWTLLLAASLHAADLPPLAPADYDRFENLDRSPAISRDGQWVTYSVTRVDRERTLYVREVQAEEGLAFPWGESAEFSHDSRHLGWIIGLSEEEKEELEKEDKNARTQVAILALGTDEPETYGDKHSFAFDATGRFVAILGYAPEELKGKGADLRILDLDAGTEVTFGNIAEYRWSETDSLLALAIATGSDDGNAVQVLDAMTGRLRGLDSSASRYHSLSWREDATDLAVLRTLAASSSEEANAVTALAWTDLFGEAEKHHQLAPGAGAEDTEMVGSARPEWSEDGSKISVGFRPCDEEEGCEKGPSDEAAEDEADETEEADSGGNNEDATADANEEGDEDSPELPEMQIWHSTDLRLFPEQQVSSDRDKRRVLLAVWHLDTGTAVPLGTELQAETELLGDWAFAIETTSAPYPWGEMFGRPYEDVWLINTTTGERSKALERVRRSRVSAEGRYLHYFDGEDHHAFEVATGESRNLTEDIDAQFADLEYDTPTDQLPPYGSGGWTEEDEAVLLYDRFDIWRVPMDGTMPSRLTDGAGDHLIHRTIDLDPDEEALQNSAGLYFRLRNENTEQRGFARWDSESGTETLLLGDAMYSSLAKAEDSETFLYRHESRTDSADLFVAGSNLQEASQVSKTNPFQDEYAWTRSELVDFKSEEGLDLQAGLLYPVNYDESKRYPMIVYTYELMAPQIHRYEVPDERRYYNFNAWTQNGYFVLMPDIVYTAREPGPSALASVRAAVQHIVDRGLVDAERVGLIGHSWGGYQATYLPTRTDIFAASVAGAPLTDFVSFMGQLHWNPGAAELSHWETGQARMEVPFWEDPDAHRRSSPIHKIHEMETPLLMAFGNEDGVVDWDQGTEFFNFARRADKQMVLLVYEGEDHGFRKEPNQRDYHRRILEWFGHYLKGEPMPLWIKEGIAYEDLEKEKERLHPGD
jgi:dipeptidyl aminopeptidase/acylaminoacyl peptidase